MKTRTVFFLFLLLTGLLTGGLLSAQPSSRVAANIAGEWTGQLEYRDFSNNQRVRLPTWLRISPDPQTSALRYDYIYDDGPNKFVKASSVLTLDFAANTVKVTSLRDEKEESAELYKAEGLEKLVDTGRGVITLTGTGKENDRPVDVRITVTFGRNLYRYEKETRSAGEPFQFRDAYAFTRRQPPA